MGRRIKHKWSLKIALIFVVLLFGISMVHAQSNYQIKVDVISGGGGVSSSTNYILSFSIGQSSGIGLQSSSNYADLAGYVYAWLESMPIYGLVDFDGDQKSDITIWRPGDGYWYTISSKDGSIISRQWGSGALNDVPVAGDYDGDGKTDCAVWRPGDYAYWYVLKSSDGGVIAEQWGSSTLNDVPVPGDYDGDGKTDIAVWRPGDGYWYIINSKDGSIKSQQWGAGYAPYNDVPVPGDYDGDGKTDYAVWRPGDGFWYILKSSDGGVIQTQWGSSALNDVLVPGDYDGDGKTDIAVWRPWRGILVYHQFQGWEYHHLSSGGQGMLHIMMYPFLGITMEMERPI